MTQKLDREMTTLPLMGGMAHLCVERKALGPRHLTVGEGDQIQIEDRLGSFETERSVKEEWITLFYPLFEFR